MPVEIKELHIKINVDESPGSSDTQTNERNEKEKLIAACIEEVMEILLKKDER